MQSGVLKLFFYVDESGHTGPNLFDENQPMLYYGVLSSKVNVDLLAEEAVGRLRKALCVPRLHAAELGNGALSKIAADLAQIQKRLGFVFDVYRVAKPDHAIICFFDQVFDQGMNPAVTWASYWTPLRYILLLKVASLFDEEMAKQAWRARIEVDDATAQLGMITVCRELRGRVSRLLDARSRQLITDALTWAESNPASISYNVSSKKSILEITPNIIGFQSVMHGIANRIRRSKRSASRIVVDQQSQFNKSQRNLAEFYHSIRRTQTVAGPGMPTASFSAMPAVPITFSSSKQSAGLELVDIHLWVFKRAMEKMELAPELYSILMPHLHRGVSDEISLNAIASRWSKHFTNIPELVDMSAEQVARTREILRIDEERRIRAVRGETTDSS